MGQLNRTILFNSSREGLYTWCDEAKVKYADEEKKWYKPHVYNASLEVPCHHEFIKLIQWHDLVFQVIEHMQFPTEIFYYEDFLTDYENQTRKILNFYELANVIRFADRPVRPTYTGSGNLFSPDDKLKIKEFILSIATEQRTIQILERY